jgi:NAD-dependent deacetylase
VRCAGQGCPNGAPCGSLAWDEQWFAPFRRQPAPETLPRCPICSGLLRPHVLWFDEFYNDHNDYGFAAAQRAVQRATTVVFVGTSFSVGITAAVLDAVQHRRLPCWAVDPHLDAAPIPSMNVVRKPAEHFLPQIVAELKALSAA